MLPKQQTEIFVSEMEDDNALERVQRRNMN
jgi:hypothetical protein